MINLFSIFVFFYTLLSYYSYTGTHTAMVVSLIPDYKDCSIL